MAFSLFIGCRKQLIGAFLATAVSTASAVTFTTGWSEPTKTLTPNIPGSASVNTVFTGYSLPWNYALYTFTVSQTGTYTVNVSTTPVTNTTYILRGTFAPDLVAPATPISNFLASRLSPSPSSPYTTEMAGLNLVAGQQYSILVAFNIGGTSADTATITMTGAGCVAISTFTCPTESTVAIPTMSQWGLIGMSGALAVFAFAALRRRRGESGCLA